MSSHKIAEMRGKTHDNDLLAISKMEESWIKVTSVNFNGSEYSGSTGRKLPIYELTKKESLYIASKFNEVAKAIL